MRATLAGLFFVISLPAGASVIYSDLPFSSGLNSGITSTIGVAAQFTALLTANLSTIDLPAAVTSGTAAYTVNIANDSSNHPGTVIESMTIASIPSTATLMTATSSAHPTLTIGSKYWIEVVAGDSTGGNWFTNSTSILGTRAGTTNGGSTWNTPFTSVLPAFDVNGTAAASTPEPSTALLLVLPLGVLMAVKSRRARCV